MSDPEQPQPSSIDNDLAVLRDYSAPSDVLLVSFSGLKRHPEKVPDFSFRGTLRDLPLKKLYLRDLNKAWFLRGLRGMTTDVEQTVAFLRAEAAAAAARRVVFAGYSFGGFAALLHGLLAGADEVHAISPQTFVSFWLRLRCRDHRWQRYVWKLHFGKARAFHDLRPLLSAPTLTRFHVYFARDSRLDTCHAAHVRGVPGVMIHEYAAGSHRLVTALRDSGELRAIFERAAVARDR